jgi:AcrR family transcriptional regulator
MGSADDTRAAILDAALAEFAAHGLAGARVERIATASGFNKNLIYVYFGSKEALFKTVIRRNSERIAAELPFTPEDLPGYAARAFDFAMANPDSLRLVGWFALENQAGEPEERSAYMAGQKQLVQEAQADGKISAAFSSGFLMTAVLALAAGWSAASPWGPAMDPHEPDTTSELRESIARAIGSLTDPNAAKPT